MWVNFRIFDSGGGNRLELNSPPALGTPGLICTTSGRLFSDLRRQLPNALKIVAPRPFAARYSEWVISPLLRWSSWLHLAKTYRWIWPPLSERPRWRTARSSPSRLPRKGRPSPAWAFGTPRKDEMTPDAVCPRWRRISAVDRRRIPRHRIFSPRNRSCCRSCNSAMGKVCLRTKCGFGDHAKARWGDVISDQRGRSRGRLQREYRAIFQTESFSSRLSFPHILSLHIYFRQVHIKEIKEMIHANIRKLQLFNFHQLFLKKMITLLLIFGIKNSSFNLYIFLICKLRILLNVINIKILTEIYFSWQNLARVGKILCIFLYFLNLHQ